MYVKMEANMDNLKKEVTSIITRLLFFVDSTELSVEKRKIITIHNITTSPFITFFFMVPPFNIITRNYIQKQIKRMKRSFFYKYNTMILFFIN